MTSISTTKLSAGGSGAGPDFDGTDAVQTHMTNSRLTDPEVLEWRFPVRLESFQIRRGSGGAGKYRGGDGVERRVRFLKPMTAVMLANHRRVAPFGVAGGKSAAVGRNWIERAAGKAEHFDATFEAKVAARRRHRDRNARWRRIRQSMSDLQTPRMLRLASASIAGTALEYYDFAVYNTLAALVFNKLFFPTFDPMSGTLLSFATFWVGYLSRPFGGILFGHLGDRHGRRFVLVITLALMGITTMLIGLLPTYAQIGVLAPILLVTLRFAQGVALGGEWAGAVLLSVEHGTDKQRGRNASFAQMGPSIGTLVATGAIALTSWLVPQDQWLEYGWRLPLLASVVLVAFGLWLRVGVSETPQFTQLRNACARRWAKWCAITGGS